MILETLLVIAAATILLLVVLLVRARRPGREAGTAETLERLERRLQTTESLSATLAERTRLLPDAMRDLTTLKTRTETLPEAVARVDGHAKEIPGQTKQLARLEGRLTVLDRIDRHVDDLHGLFHSTNGRGKSGEAAVGEVLARFPDDQWSAQCTLPTGIVDFIVHTPNGRLLPIDAKTGGGDAARALLSALDRVAAAREAEDAAAVVAAEATAHTTRRTVTERVRRSARELRRYLDPSAGTTPYLIMALPDPVFDALDPGARRACHDDGILPVPLTLLHTTISVVRRLEAHGEIDLARLSTALVRIRGARNEIDETLRNHIEKAATMVTNGARAVRTALDTIESALLTVETTATARTENDIRTPA